MTGCSTYSTWVLPLLLLPLFISFHQSSVITCRIHSFETDVANLGDSVKTCSDNCSSAHITDRKCECLNLNVSQGGCAFPKYFTEGLASLHSSISKHFATRALIKTLQKMLRTCKNEIDFCSLHVSYEPVLSPLSLYLKLESVAQQIKANRSSTQIKTNRSSTQLNSTQ